MPQTSGAGQYGSNQSGASEQSEPSSACNEIVIARNNPETSKPRSTAQSTAPMKRKQGGKGKQRSDVWDHFTKVDHPLIDIIDGVEKVVGNTKRAQCKYFSTHLACNPYDNGTSFLRKHIEIVCKGYPGRVKVESGQQVLTSDGKRGQGSLVSVNWSQDNCIEAATHMIVVDELPFIFIEKPGFNYFCSVAVPLFKVPCRGVIMKNFLRMYDAKKEELRRELKSHCVSLTTDTWTSCQNINYMVVTAHFIDRGWTMHKRVLAFCVVPNHHVITIGKLLESYLIDWSIEKVLTVSVDNASANKHAIDYLRRKMCSWDIIPVCEGRFMHVRCLAHIVNLIVRSGLKLMERSVVSIRNAVRYVRSSGARLEEFKKAVEKEKVECNKICILDVPTRWNSTFLMLDTSLELKKAFVRLSDNDERYRSYFDEEEEVVEDEAESTSKKRVSTKRVGPPTKTDWDNAAIFVKFLKVFYDVTLNVSASLTPTAHKAFHDVVTIEAELEELGSIGVGPDSSESDLVLYDMAVQMKSKYDKYFGSLDDMNQLVLVAVVLDPRYKLRNIGRVCEVWLNLPSGEIKKKSEEVKQLTIELCDLYSQSNDASSGGQKKKTPITSELTTSNSRGRSRALSGKRVVMLEDWNRQLEQNNEVVVRHKVDRYLLDPIEKPEVKQGEECDWKILDGWKLNGGKYPNLQALARDVLAIQVSTVASESSFSTGKRVIDPYRSSLTPRTVEKLICLQNWLKSDSIMGLEYVPSVEEMETYEQLEAEHEKEDRDKVDNVGGSAEAPSVKTTKTKSSEASVSAPATKKKKHKK